jgi:hypothetical protein
MRVCQRIAWDASGQDSAQASLECRIQGRHQGGDGHGRYAGCACGWFIDRFGQELIRWQGWRIERCGCARRTARSHIGRIWAGTEEARKLLRSIVALRFHQIWPQEITARVEPGTLNSGAGIEEIQRKLLALSPQNDAQRGLKATALQLTVDIVEARWLVVEQTGSSIQWPFLVILVFWLALISAGFGLFAPANSSVIFALFACSLSVAACGLSNRRNE